MVEDRLSISSTRMNLKTLESKLKSVEKGHSLLKSKCDALQIHFREIESEIESKKTSLETLFKDAFKLLNEAKLMGADVEGFKMFCRSFSPVISTKVELKFGIAIAAFEIDQCSIDFSEALWKGGYKLKAAKMKFDELLRFMVEFCSLQNAYRSLEYNLEATSKRKNSLEHMMIPKIKSTAKYIEDTLDEAEREEFFRLKKIQGSKKSQTP